MPPLSGETTKKAPLDIGPVAHKNHHTSRMHKFIGITTSGFFRRTTISKREDEH